MKRQIKIKSLSLALLTLIIFTACNSDDSVVQNSQAGVNTGSGINQGISITRDFFGKVLDETNQPIPGAMVTIGSQMVSTNLNGIFVLNNVAVNKKQAIIIIEKTGYLKGIKTVVPTDGINQIRAKLIQENLVATVMSGVPSSATLTNGTKVSFDGNFKDANGVSYSGSVKVYMYHLEANNPDIEVIMPGNLQALNSNNQERILETYGMLNVELVGDSGQKLNIGDGSTAEIEMLIDAAQTNAPNSIPLWYFNETTGVWEEEGLAVKQGNKYLGSVSHFSWWNCDAQFPTVTFCLEVVDGANATLANVRVELFRPNATYPRVGYSNGNGEICGLIPSNEILTLKAFDQCGVEVHAQSIGPFSVDTNLGQIVLPTVTATLISGYLVDCNNLNVTNGYVTLNYGTLFSDIPTTTGAFNFSVIQCATLNDFTLEGVDYNTFQTTGDISFNFSNTNVGNILACNAVTEFISLQIDNEPVVYYLNNITTAQTVSTYLTISSNNPTGTDYFYIGGPNSTLGTFDSTVYSIESSIMNINYNLPINISYNLNAFGAVGEYIDMNFSGTYTDNSGNVRSVIGTAHVLRD